MAFPTFTPPNGVNLTPGSSVDYEPRVLRAPFGDGYVQRSGDGLNSLARKLDAAFEVLTRAEAQTIIEFFTDRKGYLPFMFILPGETTPRQWIAPSWRTVYSDGKLVNVTATLEENFDPA